MTILVTGAAGFIGSHLAETLLATTDHAVLGVDDFCDYYAPAQKRANVAGFVRDKRATFCEGDVADTAFTEGLFERHRIDAVVHLAAHAGVTPSVAAPRRYFENNVLGTLALMEAVRRRPVRRFVFVSSSTVYGVGCPAPFQEDGPLGVPASPYGASKRAAELMCQTFHQLHGAPIVIVRPFSVYGSRLRPDLALSAFARRLWAGAPVTIFGDGTVRRDFTHVSDICQGLIAALEAPDVDGEAINLGHGQPLAINDIVTTLAGALGRPARVEYRDGRAEDLPVTHADLTKARALLGYRPRVEFADGVREFAAWFVDAQQRTAAQKAESVTGEAVK